MPELICEISWPRRKLVTEDILYVSSCGFVHIPFLVWQQLRGSLREGKLIVHFLVDRTFCLTLSHALRKAVWPFHRSTDISSPLWISIYKFFRLWTNQGLLCRYKMWKLRICQVITIAMSFRGINILVTATGLWHGYHFYCQVRIFTNFQKWNCPVYLRAVLKFWAIPHLQEMR